MKTLKQKQEQFANGLRCVGIDAMMDNNLAMCNHISILLDEFNQLIKSKDTIEKNKDMAERLYQHCVDKGYYARG